MKGCGVLDLVRFYAAVVARLALVWITSEKLRTFDGIEA